MIAAAGTGYLPERPDARTLKRLESEVSLASMASRAPNALSPTMATADRNMSISEAFSEGTVRRNDRNQSRNRRDHRQQQSQSTKQSQFREEALPSVGNYALTVLFTAVC